MSVPCAATFRYAVTTRRPSRAGRHSFTLVELMIVISLLTILATVALVATYSVVDDAKEARTKVQVVKLHSLLMERWESYRTRTVPLRLAPGIDPKAASMLRLAAIRELMRMELPDRKTDVASLAVSGITAPPLWQAYNRMVKAAWGKNWASVNELDSNGLPQTWTTQHQGAECLYLIVSTMRYGDSTALDFFKTSEIGDLDLDGMPEILDAWGRPLQFLRWAPGYSIGPGADGQWGVAQTDDDGDGVKDDIGERGWTGSDDLQLSELQRIDPYDAPDPFDPLRVDQYLRQQTNRPARTTFALYPLIFSVGRDGIRGLITDNEQPPLQYAAPPKVDGKDANLLNDPYLVWEVTRPDTGALMQVQLGLPWLIDSAAGFVSADDITNQLIEAR